MTKLYIIIVSISGIGVSSGESPKSDLIFYISDCYYYVGAITKFMVVICDYYYLLLFIISPINTIPNT